MNTELVIETLKRLRIPKNIKWARYAVFLVVISITPVLHCNGERSNNKEEAKRGRYNIMLVSFDCLRYDHVGCNGYELNTTPNIDQLAEKGTNFMRAYSQSSWTAPSHMTIMTSLYPAAHEVNVHPKPAPLHPIINTVAAILQAAGYRTGGFISGTYVKSVLGFARGFDRYDENFNVERSSDEVNKQVISWFEGNNENPRRPFFLFVHYFDPHEPYDPPPPYDSMFNPVHNNEPGKNSRDILKYFKMKRPGEGVNREMLKNLIGLYDGEIRHTDDRFGELLNFLKQNGEFDNTLIIVTADHGEAFLDHKNQLRHGNSLYEELIHVPFVIKLPKQWKQREVSDAIVQHLDISPTILDILGLPVPDNMQGKSLLPLMTPENSPKSRQAVEDTAYSELIVRINREDTLFLESVVTERWKLVWDRSKDTFELFDLHANPGEQINVDYKNPEIVNTLKRSLVELSKENLSRQKARDSVKKGELNEEILKELKALGYIRNQ